MTVYGSLPTGLPPGTSFPNAATGIGNAANANMIVPGKGTGTGPNAPGAPLYFIQMTSQGTPGWIPFYT